MRHTRALVPGLLGFALALGGCDSKPPAVEKQPATAAALAAKPAPAGKVLVRPATVVPEAEDLRHDPTDRDPFLNPTQGKPPIIHPPPPGLKFPGYALDELKLTAIVDGPGTRARAMFRGPKGMGKLLGRGETLGKAAARIKAILSDRVVLQIRKGSDNNEQVADRVIKLETRGRKL